MTGSSQSDFDFLKRRWRVRHRRLAARLVDSRDWQEFEGTMTWQPVCTRFLWTDVSTPTPHWEQAASVDGGRTWETNWTMRFVREDE